MTCEELKAKIYEKFPGIYSESGMETVLDDIEMSKPEIREAIEKYLIEGIETEMESTGYSYSSLKEKNMNSIAAYLTLNWLTEEPEKAKAAIERGYDIIVGI